MTPGVYALFERSPRKLASLVLCFFLIPCWHADPASPGLFEIRKEYESYRIGRGEGRLRAILDPESHYLFIAEASLSGIRLRKINWTTRSLVAQKEYDAIRCDVDHFGEMEFLRQTNLIHLRDCNVHYLVDPETLSIVQKVLEAERYGERVVFSLDGTLAFVTEYLEAEKAFRAAMYQVKPWSKISDWDFAGGVPTFTPDARFLVVRTSESGPSAHAPGVRVMNRCGLAFFEVASQKQSITWANTAAACPATLRFIPGTQYLIVDNELGRGLVVRDATDGRILYELPSDLQPSTLPEVSPGGRFVVTGAWNDPQDQKWSRDFIIWDLNTHEVVYQTPKYRSVWGRNTHGREVYPRFSEDGKHLIVVREERVELYAISARE